MENVPQMFGIMDFGENDIFVQICTYIVLNVFNEQATQCLSLSVVKCFSLFGVGQNLNWFHTGNLYFLYKFYGSI